MMTGIEVPLEVAALLCAGCAAAGAWFASTRANRRFDPRRAAGDSPLEALHRPEVFSKAIDLATRRNAMRDASLALLHGRIDQLTGLHAALPGATQAEVREQIAAVMRAGLRRGDSMAITDGDAFTITVAGADERAALRIAERLRRKIAQLRLPHLGLDTRLTASFGVAAQRSEQDEAALTRRARQALEAAMARGQDHVVPASEIEEIRLLPPPAPSSSSSSAAAA